MDDRCINCGAVRHIAPGLLVEHGGSSVFARQPQTDEELRLAWLASEMCPTRSVRTASRTRPPDGLYPHELAPGVYLCGHNARSSYGAHSYFIHRPEGNVLVDSPVFTKKLIGPFEKMGGISKIFLSHRDDVADADKWARHFQSEVYIHQAERQFAPYATHTVEGGSPSDATEVGAGLLFIPLPGHTEGSATLLVDGELLFTGDSLCWSPSQQALHAFRSACWYSWSVQKQSLTDLSAYSFSQVFAGHGSWSPRFDAPTMRRHLLALVGRM